MNRIFEIKGNNFQILKRNVQKILHYLHIVGTAQCTHTQTHTYINSFLPWNNPNNLKLQLT